MSALIANLMEAALDIFLVLKLRNNIYELPIVELR